MNQTQSYTTQRRQLYMLPTKVGWMFSLMVFALFLASIKFSHQPTFLLTFLLSALAITSSLHTHKNINNLTMTLGNAAPCFVNERLSFPITLHNPLNNHRHSIWVMCGDFQECVDVPANESTTLTIQLTAKRRGEFTLPKVSLTTHYPIGILFSWSRAFQSTSKAIVYPKPLDLLSSPSMKDIESDESVSSDINQTKRNSGEQISSLKNYQSGDRLRDIHWPAFAKTGKLVSKEYDQDTEQRLVFSWDDMGSLGLEEKLSQLSYWILKASEGREKVAYQLSIPNFESEYSASETHTNLCLEKLALFPSLATWGESQP